MSSEVRADIAEKHAVVTGGARGIGLAIATLLASRGARVSIVSRSVHETPTTADAESSGEFFRAAADVRSEEQVVHALNACREAHGPIAILVNNSGIAESAPLMRTGLAMWEQIVGTNLTGTFLCSREAVEDMLLAKWGRIVNIASTAGLGGAAYISAYCASKHGVVGFTRAIAAEFAGTGVTANVVCPGYTETDMMRKAMANITKFTGASEDAAREKLAQSNPGGRIASVEEVAAGVLDLITGSRSGAAMVIPGGAIV
ncbi:MAG TPA: SDR family oxidoreductase [Candidatus Baltobacteraceae bacterium]|nr:SDR family oxidoreductase [Candidatus Baltobacteraceae bacterium]